MDPWVRRLWKLVRSYAKIGSVRLVKGAGSQRTPTLDLAYGGRTNGEGNDSNDSDGDSVLIEPHGLAGGIGVGYRALVLRLGAVYEKTVSIGARNPRDRPNWVEEGEVCLYSPFQSRVALRKDGSLTLESGLADYKDASADDDEGSTIRLAKGGEKGELEVYAETSVLLRSQAAGGSGPAASVFLESNGTLTLSGDGDGVLAVITLAPDGTLSIETDSNTSITSSADVSVTADGNIDAEAAGTLEVRNAAGTKLTLSGADVIVTPGAGGVVKLGAGAGLDSVALAAAVKTEIDVIVGTFNGHSHVALGGPPAPLLVPSSSTASSNVQAKI